MQDGWYYMTRAMALLQAKFSGIAECHVSGSPSMANKAAYVADKRAFVNYGISVAALNYGISVAAYPGRQTIDTGDCSRAPADKLLHQVVFRRANPTSLTAGRAYPPSTVSTLRSSTE